MDTRFPDLRRATTELSVLWRVTLIQRPTFRVPWVQDSLIPQRHGTLYPPLVISSLECFTEILYALEHRYGCRSVGTDTENFPFGSCIDTTNRNVPCSSNCNSPCTSDTQLVAIIYPTAPNITADSSNSIVCTEYAVTITGIGFDHNTPSNNIVRLSAQDTSNNAVTSFDGTCEVSEATRTSIVCVFTSLDCDQLDLNYYLLAEVAINLTTVNDGYGSVRSAGISNFVTITS